MVMEDDKASRLSTVTIDANPFRDPVITPQPYIPPEESTTSTPDISHNQKPKTKSKAHRLIRDLLPCVFPRASNMASSGHVEEPRNFAPKNPPNLNPPKDDPITVAELAQCDGMT